MAMVSDGVCNTSFAFQFSENRKNFFMKKKKKKKKKKEKNRRGEQRGKKDKANKVRSSG